MRPTQLPARLRPHLPAVAPGLLAVALMLVWAVHNGGYDNDTWYWGALVSLALLAAVVIGLGHRRLHLGRPGAAALTLFGLYVGWSYLSISWAQAPGVALQGSNRALLYLLVFALMTVLPWTAEAALGALVTFAVGVGVIAVVLVVRLAAGDQIPALIDQGRLAAPTGYFNSTAALFTIDALTGIGLAARRELPGPLRGLLLALSGASLQLAVVVQSRGWLFTLPLVVILAAILSSGRIRFALASVIPVVVTLIPVRHLLRIYDSTGGAGLGHTATQAGRPALVLLALAFGLGTLLAWGDGLARTWVPSRGRMRLIGVLAVTVAVAGGLAGALVVTHGRPFAYVSRQWNGFSHQQTASAGSHFVDVGSGRYDFWRVAIDAFLAHPVGGLGQDNFADYYVSRRRTREEPSWTHSLELRMLAHTGLVGFLLFGGFLACAITAALRTRRRAGPLARGLAGVALLPLIVWTVHGSLDWFWEIPALSAPALGFLGLAGSLGVSAPGAAGTGSPSARAGARTIPGTRRRPRLAPAGAAIAIAGALAAAMALGFSYLSVREVSLASDVQGTDPAAALQDLSRAAQLNPLDASPDRLAGVIALQSAQYTVAQQRFRRSIEREPGGWFAWLGAGLAASGLGQTSRAARDFRVAYSINDRQPAISVALARVRSAHPLTPAAAFSLLIIIP